MTVTLPPPAPPVAPETLPPAAPAVKRRRFQLPTGGRRAAAITGLSLLAVVLVVLGFEAVVTRLMHRERQNHLAADIRVPRNRVPRGSAAAVLQIPSLELNVMVIEGDSAADLRAGPGHRVSTPLPGANGNSVILGHRSRYGGPFGSLSRLKVGDEVYVRSRTDRAARHPVRFVVRSVTVVPAADHRPLEATDDRRLTLVTSAGGWTSSDRWVVIATTDLDPCLAGPRGERPAPTCTGSGSSTAAPPPATAASATSTSPTITPNVGATPSSAAPVDSYDAGRASPMPTLGVLAILVAGMVLTARALAARYRPRVIVAALSAPAVMVLFLFLLNVDNFLVVTK